MTTQDQLPKTIALRADLQLQTTDEPGAYLCKLIGSGRTVTRFGKPGRIVIPAEALRRACESNRFLSAANFIDHSGWDGPSLYNLAGCIVEQWFDDAEQAAMGKIRLYDTAAGKTAREIYDQIIEDRSKGIPTPNVGLSAVISVSWLVTDDEEDWTVSEINACESTDFVFGPAADGRVRKALSALLAEPTPTPIRAGGSHPTPNPVRAGGSRPTPNPVRAGGSRPTPTTPQENPPMTQPTTPTPDPIPTPLAAAPAPSSPSPQQGEGRGEGHHWLAALAETTATMMIHNSGLPEACQTRLAAKAYTTPEEVQTAIEEERDLIAALNAANAIQIGGQPPRGHLGGMSMGIDWLAEAFEALMLGQRPKNGRPLTGVREMYIALTGDYEMRGLFRPENVQLAAVDSSTMASITANVMNKIVHGVFQEYPRWWEDIVAIEDFTTLQNISWITLGGIGELPTVPEGQPYNEMTWDDKAETSAFLKKGGYIGITLEAVDKDDTLKIQAIPRLIARAAWLSLSKSLARIFTDNNGAGPLLSDGLALFHADRGNLVTSPLSRTAWLAARNTMRKFSELHSAERLGGLTAPKYLLGPIDLEDTGLKILGSDADYTFAAANAPAAPVNPEAEGDTRESRMAVARKRYVTVDLWTDPYKWAAVADPRLYPSLGLGFRFGRQPEVFSVASPTAGLVFTADTLPVKCRFFYSAGVIDWRGIYKSNAAS